MNGMNPSAPITPSAFPALSDPAGEPWPLELQMLPPGPLTSAELVQQVSPSLVRRHYHRIWHGMYRREDQADGLEIRSRALAKTFPDGVLRGRSAALMWGDDSAPEDAPPEIWLPATRRTRQGRVYRYGAMPGHAITEVDGVRVTTPLRTCRDLAVDLEFEDAVVSVERLCAMVAELPAQLRAAADHPSGRGARDFEQVVRACDPRSVSAMSSRARMVLADAGCGDFGHGHQVRLGRNMVELPLADPVARCAVYTSPAPASVRWERSSQAGDAESLRARRDRASARHQSRLQGAGWTVIIVRELARGAATLLPRPGTDTGPAGVARRAAGLLAARWPTTELRLPAHGEAASDPHGLWGAPW
ncbi:hypothetical protein GCM10022294_18650 [Dietzia aurantiaca]